MTAEERFQKIEEHLLVTAELMRTNERKWDERFGRHDARLTRVEEVMERLAASQQKTLTAVDLLGGNMEKLAQEQALTRAALQSLIETVDRFIQGRGGDGH